MSTQSLRRELTGSLKRQGASLVGFADLRELPRDVRDQMDFGISIAVALDPQVMATIYTGPSMEYYEDYTKVNALLTSLTGLAADILTRGNHQARPKAVIDTGIDMKTLSTILPHKTVATRAGLGWIGKCALLVTKEYGPAVRISTVLTDIDLGAGTPINSSHCGDCRNCVEACPGQAPSGKNWNVARPRDSFFDAYKCRITALECAAKIGIKDTICGRCIAVCPWTERYREQKSSHQTGPQTNSGQS